MLSEELSQSGEEGGKRNQLGLLNPVDSVSDYAMVFEGRRCQEEMPEATRSGLFFLLLWLRAWLGGTQPLNPKQFVSAWLPADSRSMGSW